MRRFLILISILLLIALPTSATGIQSDTVISPDGSCQVAMTVKLHLDTVPGGLTFPLPAGATDITVNGASVRARLENGLRQADLSGLVAAPGDHTLVIRYTLADAVTAGEKDTLVLTLPILCGFRYPMDSLEFSVTLPGAPEYRPNFSSTYYQETVETMMTVQLEGATVRGALPFRLQDHETLTMTLQVTEEMFPQPVAKMWSMDTVDLVMLSIAGVSLLYWLIFMGCAPLKRLRRTAPPDGITAGELGCRLIGAGADLTMMVLSWAQMGYLLIQPDSSNRVLLHKRMDMGNERSEFENRYFRKLFGRRNIIDGTGHHYALLCRKVALLHPGSRAMYQPYSGNPLLFRGLCACAGAASGVSLASAYTDGGWRIVLSILLAVGGFFAAWAIQSLGKSIHLRQKRHICLAALAAALWLWLSFGVGEWNIALIQIPCQFLAGLGALYGGRRTEAGRNTAGEILGLRHYLKNVSAGELQRIMESNPQYYYDLAPWAYALGVDKALTRRLKEVRLPECPYLTTGLDGHMTAPEWNLLLSDTVKALDNLQKRFWFDRLLGR